MPPSRRHGRVALPRNRITGGTQFIASAPPRAPPYGNSTFTLKNRWPEFVGHIHATSVKFVLPRTVYIRISPLVLRLGGRMTIGMSFDIAITVRRKSFRATELFFTQLYFVKATR